MGRHCGACVYYAHDLVTKARLDSVESLQSIQSTLIQAESDGAGLFNNCSKALVKYGAQRGGVDVSPQPLV